MSNALMSELCEDRLPASTATAERHSSACDPAFPRVLVVANNQLLRDALEAAIDGTAGLEVIGTAEQLSVPAVRDCLPDVLLMDVAPSHEATTGYVRELAAFCPELKTIIIDVPHTGTGLMDLLEAGASGLLLKRATLEEILRTTWAVLGGATVIPQSLTRSLFTVGPDHAGRGGSPGWRPLQQVTRREHQIICLVAEGLSNKEIASTLNIATFTVKSHLHSVLQKLGLQTRAQIARDFLLGRIPRAS